MSVPQVYFDIAIGGKPAGRLIFELRTDVVPRTAENFLALVTGEKGISSISKKKLSYKGCAFHRLIPGFMLQGGDFTRGDGTGGESIYGPRFADENFKLKHDRPYLLSMANAGPNTNASQFFITFAATPHLDGKHVVFGRLIDGVPCLRQLEQLPTGANDKPRQPVVIAECGLVTEDMPGQAAAGTAGTAHTGPVITRAADLFGKSRGNVLSSMRAEGVPLSFGASHGAGGAGAGMIVAEESRLSSLVQQGVSSKQGKATATSLPSVRGLGSSLGRGLGGIAAMLQPIAKGDEEEEEEEQEGRQDAGKKQAEAAAQESTIESAAVDAEPDDSHHQAERGPSEVGTTEQEVGTQGHGTGAGGNAAQDRLHALRQKLAAQQRGVRAEVAAEARRTVDPTAATRHARGGGGQGDEVARQAAAHKAKLADLERQEQEGAESAAAPSAAAGAPSGGTSKRKRGEDVPDMLRVTAAEAEIWEEKQAEKAARVVDSYGWAVMGPGAQHRSYEKRLKALPGAKEGGASGGELDASARAAAAMGPHNDDLLATVAASSVAYTRPGVEALDRMTSELDEVAARRAAFSRRRAVGDDASVPYVNEANRAFNARIAKDFDKYTVEVKQALERGTAL